MPKEWSDGSRFDDGFLKDPPAPGQAVSQAPPSGSLAEMLKSGNIPKNDGALESGGKIVHAMSEEEAEVLRKAKSPGEIEGRLRGSVSEEIKSVASIKKQHRPHRPQIWKRGDKAYHTKTNTKVTIIEPDAAVGAEGKILHVVMMKGSSKKFKVPEENLRRRD